MNLFADYIQPLTAWLQQHPNWALFITFFISLTESLAIIGSIIPGSVTMTAIGILAGSGVLRVDYTLIAATFGAIAGDSLSYAIGYYYSEQMGDIWPFRKYPNWFIYGKEFFARHGGKSVLIGRFIGPLRSLIPIIAGVMHMKQWRFLIANILSAIGWAFLYVIPGVLIGAASHGLSEENATRLFLLILVGIAGIWFISMIIKWLVVTTNSYFKNNLDSFWNSFKNNSLLNSIYSAITPKNETTHYLTAMLFLLTLTSIIVFIILTVLNVQDKLLDAINQPINLLMHSLHTPTLRVFFIICTQLTSYITITTLFVLCCLWFIYRKCLTSILYITSLIITSNLIAIVLAYFLESPRPEGLQVTMAGSSFPVFNLLIATAFYGFLLFYITNRYSLLTSICRGFILLILGLSGLGVVYLGDAWFSDVIASYSTGGTICLIHFLIYRKNNRELVLRMQSPFMLVSIMIAIISATAVSTYINFATLNYNHTLYHKEYVLSEYTWWNQQKPILPLYRLNRVGKRSSLLNIQYVGDLDGLRRNLTIYGWELHEESFFIKLLMRMSTDSNDIKFPLFAQLYENNPPQLIMTYKDKAVNLVIELNLWQSNYFIVKPDKPIWIGIVNQNLNNMRKKQLQNETIKPVVNYLTYIMPGLNKFTVRRLELQNDMIKPTLLPSSQAILLIKPSS